MKPQNPSRPFLHARGAGIAVLAAVLATPLAAQREAETHSRPVDRRFSFVEETLHGASPGHLEFEQWVTWSHGTRADSDFDRFAFKHEIEYGISEGVHFAIDLAEWHTSDVGGDYVTRYDATGAELKFRFTDPRSDALGVAFKTELGLGPHELEWQNVLVLDKIVDRWEVAYNLVAEAGLESDRLFEFGDGELGITQKLGVSYEVEPSLYVGAEMVYEIPPDWTWGERQNFFAGPDLAVRGNEWAMVMTAMALLDGEATAPEFQFRLVFEIDF
ncbi:MAG: hypothetical protein KDC98_23860 [Planctomycetes bacterium]|nr:hypothetical protein [Planctomycetota bacterium]